MNPEQTEYFLAALQKLMLTASEGVERDGKIEKLRDSELRSGLMFLWLAREANGYLNLTHSEAQLICDTDKNSTLRAYLIRLRNANVLSDYSTNGTVRMKFTGYPGRELITHRREQKVLPDITNLLPTVTNSRCGVTPDEESSETRDGASRVCYPTSRDRAVASLLRDTPSRVSRNFDDQPSTKLVSKLDLISPTETEANLLTATAIDPVEHALSVAFLVSAGFWAKTAKELAGRHRFELLRRAVGFWWSNRRSNGGEFADKPGIVLTWLANLENTVIPEKLSMDFMCSDLYMNHRTAEERAAMVQDEADAEQCDDDAESEDDNQPWPEMNEFWAVALERMREELPATTFNTWMEGSRAEFDDRALTCTVIVDSKTKQEWLNARLRQMITREVRKSTGYNLSVTVEVRRRS